MPSATVYSDHAVSCDDLKPHHEAVEHGIGEYVRDQSDTNGIESFWSMLNCGYVGIYRKLAQKHLDVYGTWKNVPNVATCASLTRSYRCHSW